MAENSGVIGGIVETVKTIVYALLIAGIFRTVFFQPFWIPSGSMKDTLLIGDFLFVNKMAYGYSYASCPSIRVPALGVDIGADDFCGFLQSGNGRLFGSEPERGDVVVFRHPVTGRDFIKRLIGLPGDRVQMKGGLLYINDEAVSVEDTAPFVEVMEYQGPQGLLPRCANGAVGQGANCEKQRKIDEGMDTDWFEKLDRNTAPSGRILRPDEIAATAVHFLSDELGPVSGPVLELEQFPFIGRNPPKC